ncbi:HAD-superfamily hydrolase [Clostridium pasteurianum DSM 525 = ATCC 6013]|uniref:Cof-like hydrolase n=1 Tax=Clostridium pasteurianum DSM 525 = ATCC 6013 TaxID=1262449 RepID=A0A0H3J8U6_CLOPA|nr:Cof-type HAD-IIB family hydrolase [Clostridium pasteurianum]AJA49647.1 HAD-superfamily hydrolase [Clostridium pasteurianum DSM 525 = ATCC 6013]AJA53635.1 HAD-superfamily hydrolase [Clostridium pasteurianum DSM 525 = ATCC 6013]AOZ76799.1 hypothetical protein AQ983_17450 [Clostridium pasteurianum DSM 525 = ATCC 6013]AOZ80596.1 hypothetical protein AQ984_17445 [Clostridium pasteurianum]ELP58837.1 HAD-superfamily hydrolase [Clostridium pasteurianum DSM 525 = ATCC 6013]
MKYELVALDIDGTILNSNMLITEETKIAVKLCKKNGVKVVLSSGRLSRSIKPYIERLDLNGYQVTLNGAVIKDADTGNILEKFTIPKNDYMDVLKKLNKFNYSTIIFGVDTYYKNYDNEDIRIIEKISGMNAEFISSFKDIVNPTKTLSIIEDIDSINVFRNKIESEKYTIIRTGYNHVEVVRKDIDKGTALKIIADKYNIPREKVLAIGDSENDIGMLKYAGKGIAMGNAYDNVKEISDEITASCDEEGVAKALYKNVL